MVKFLHTADWQLGMKAAQLGVAAEKVRDARFDTVHRLMRMADEHEVDFVLVCGDVFEDNGVSDDVITRTAEALGTAKGTPVYILPGNHDPLSADSIYRRRSWVRSMPANVRVLEKAEPIKTERGGAMLYPCPIRQKISKADPTAWIPNEDTGAVRVGVAHGTLNTGQASDRPDFPIAPDRAAQAGLDYLAMGDWHSLLVHSDGRTVYPGTPEPEEFGHRDAGHALIVTIDAPGVKPGVETLDTAIFTWMEIEREVSSKEDLEAVLSELRGVKDPEHTVARVLLRGAVPVEVKEAADTIKEPSLAFLQTDTSRLYLRPDEAGLLAQMPGNIARETMESLLVLMSRHPTRRTEPSIPPEEAEERLRELVGVGKALDAPPEVLERAIEHLYALSKEVER